MMQACLERIYVDPVYERACMSRERSVAKGEGGKRACMSREECCGRRGRREGVYVAGGVLLKEREEREMCDVFPGEDMSRRVYVCC